MKHGIRIIGGKNRGQKLQVPNISGLRPTPNQARETLFNWLMHDIKDSICLDAFAGSGALGFEALSRGASRVVFLEKINAAYVNLKKNALQLNQSNCSILNIDALSYLKKATESFDIVFLDPPFSCNYWQAAIELLTQNNVIKKNGWLYTESPQSLCLDKKAWQIYKQKRQGQVISTLYKKTNAISA